MNGKVREIIEQIVQSVVSLDGLDRIEKKLSAQFRKKGYKFGEIRQAFDYIFRLLEAAGERPVPEQRPVRILSRDENLKLTPDAKSMIFRLYYCSEIDPADLERILGFVSSQDRVLTGTDIAGLLGGSLRETSRVVH